MYYRSGGFIVVDIYPTKICLTITRQVFMLLSSYFVVMCLYEASIMSSTVPESKQTEERQEKSNS